MNFSIIFPTRERTELLKKCLESIDQNTEDTDRIEVLLAIDDDDKRTDYGFLEDYSFVRAFRVRRSVNFSKDYYNFLASQSRGKWIICANDDCQFETSCWDSVAYNILKDRSNVIYGFINDGMDGFRVKHYGKYCSFPLQGREGYNVLGYIFPDRIPIWGSNLWVKALYEQIGSVVELPILVKHYTHRNKTRSIDHINEQITRKYMFYKSDSTEEEYEKLLNAFKKHTLTGNKI